MSNLGLAITSLFSGVGALDYGLELSGLGYITSQVEIDSYCQNVLERHFPAARADLETEWYNVECLSLDEQIGGGEGPGNSCSPDAGLYGSMPQIDSKVVSKASPVVERHLGCKLPLDVIRRGGYNSFDDVMSDLTAKLRSRCMPSTSAKTKRPEQNQTNV